MFGRNKERDPNRPVRKFRVRRAIGIALILAILWLVAWLLFFSGIADPIVLAATPAYNQLAAMINDPLGIDWGGKLMLAAAVIIPHIGLLMFIFDDQLR